MGRKFHSRASAYPKHSRENWSLSYSHPVDMPKAKALTMWKLCSTQGWGFCRWCVSAVGRCLTPTGRKGHSSLEREHRHLVRDECTSEATEAKWAKAMRFGHTKTVLAERVKVSFCLQQAPGKLCVPIWGPNRACECWNFNTINGLGQTLNPDAASTTWVSEKQVSLCPGSESTLVFHLKTEGASLFPSQIVFESP